MSDDDKKMNSDDLLAALRRAENAADQSSKPEKPKPENESAYDKADKSRGFIGKKIQELKNSVFDKYSRARNAFDTAGVIWNSYLKPISFVVNPIASLYWKASKSVFNKFSHDEDGTFNKFKAAPTFLLISAFTAVAGFQMATNVIPFTAKFAYDAAVIETFAHEETLIFGQANVLDVDRNLWGVSACTEYPCEAQDDTIEFRIRDSSWLDAKRLITHFEPHDPGELQAAFNSEQSICNVETYGRRIKLPLVPISWGTWPLIIDATCVPVDSDNWQEQIEFMQGLRADAVQPAPMSP